MDWRTLFIAYIGYSIRTWLCKMTRLIIKVCSKRKHGTVEAAEKHIEKLCEGTSQSPDDFRIYCCDLCSFYHVGHKESKVVRERKKHGTKKYTYT
jgi:hypothetical protein